MLWTTLAVFTVACLEEYYERGRSKYILIELTKCDTSANKKKNDALYIIQCFYQALRYSIVYINEDCQASIIFNNLGFGRVMKEELHIYLAKHWRCFHNII